MRVPLGTKCSRDVPFEITPKNIWMFPLSAPPHLAACPRGAARRQRRAPLRERQAGRAGRRRARQGSVTPCAGRRSLEPRPAPRVQGRRRQQCSAAGVWSLGARLRRAEPGHRVAAVRQVAAGGASAVGAADAAAQRTRGRGGGAGNERGYGDELGEGDMHVGSPDAARAQDVVSRWWRRARSWRRACRDGRSHRGRGARPRETIAPVATSATGSASPVDGGGDSWQILAAFFLVYYTFSLSQQLSPFPLPLPPRRDRGESPSGT